ncbi:MAG: putative bifunctional diguanylate cyclase/phosphodiesterase [Desulfurivibrio sp.]
MGSLNTTGDQPDSLIKVLVVEKDPEDALLIQRALLGAGSGGFVVKQATSLAAARRELARETPDVLLLSPDPVDSSGSTAVATMRREAPQLPMIVLTSRDDRQTALTIPESGAQDYLAKSALDSYSLHQAIRYAITRTHLENRLQETNRHLEDLLDKVRTLNIYDALTGLPNRRRLLEQLERGLALHARAGWYGALLVIDLGNFRVVNDTLGNNIGDLLLIETARRLQSCVRETDIVSRLGSDEFAVILEYLDQDIEQAAIKAGEISKKLRRAINQPFVLKGHECHVGVNLGVCVFGRRDELFDECLLRASVATYQAKKAGRNLIRFFDDAMQATLEERARQEAELRRALRKKELFLYFQPQVDRSGRPVGAEALIRWQHPVHGLIFPAFFISLAEETGLIQELGHMVLTEACAHLKEWQQQPELADLVLAVNISAYQFRQADFVNQVREVIMSSAIRPERLKLELTESALLEDIGNAVAKMKDLAKMGLSISLDDFGTGYSSLSYLKQLPVNQLKIDRSFIANVTDDSGDTAIIRAILAMAAELGIEVVAEGVENEMQHNFLQQHHCSRFQGYLFARPMPAADFVAFATAQRRP